MSRYHHGDLRRALVDAALQLLHDGGVQKLSLRQVARAASVSHAAPYRHFASRTELLASVAEVGFEQLGSAIKSATTSAETPQRQLLAESRQYLNFALKNPHLYRLMFGPEVNKLDFPSLAQTSMETFNLLVIRLHHVHTAEQRPEDSVHAQAIVLWSTLHGLAHLMLDGQLGTSGLQDVDDLIQRAIQR